MTITRAQTRAALVESIEHWRGNENATTFQQISVQPRDCALCGAFAPSCSGCPVAIETDDDSCEGSPYNDAYWAWEHLKCTRTESAFDTFRAAAKTEREFLEMLLAKHGYCGRQTTSSCAPKTSSP